MSVKLTDETTESWRLNGQQLFEFVLKSSESLHNVINRAKISSIQTTIAKKKPLKKKINFQNRTAKNQLKKNRNIKKQLIELSHDTNDIIPVSTQPSLDYDFDLSSSSCEQLNEIPMEELLSSPTWKQIVEQNSFIWP